MGATPTQRRTTFWAPFVHPQTVWKNEPDDGHEHDFQHVSPKRLGSFGPTCTCCVLCGWIESWGKP